MMKQFTLALAFLSLIIAIGTTGYVIIEKWDILDAFYMTIISITTTGFSEIRPLSPMGRMFTTSLIVFGVGTFAYIGGRGMQILLEQKLLRRRRMNRKVVNLNNHYIVCGYGRLGRTICHELYDMKVPFVVIEKKESLIEELMQSSMLFLHGDATHDDTLQKAGIEKARGLMAVLATDADNVYLTLSAKVLKPDIFVVTRALEEETERKLKRAGADRIVKPYDIGATRMVHLLTRPGVVDFMDVVASKGGHDLGLEEIVLGERSPLKGHTLSSSPIRQEMNVIIVAIYRENGEFIYNPISSTVLAANDRLIAIGQTEGLAKLNDMCS